MTRYEEGRAASDRRPDRSTHLGLRLRRLLRRAPHRVVRLWLVTRDRHEAEELTQDAFVKVWERWDGIRELQDPEGYLYRTGMNLFRNRRRRVALAVRRGVHLAPPPGDEIRTIDDRDAVVRALGRLTPRQRVALILMDLVGFSSEEAGDALGVRPSTVRVLAARGRGIIRRQMGDPDG